jgi:hypothetical protein
MPARVELLEIVLLHVAAFAIAFTLACMC